MSGLEVDVNSRASPILYQEALSTPYTYGRRPPPPWPYGSGLLSSKEVDEDQDGSRGRPRLFFSNARRAVGVRSRDGPMIAESRQDGWL
jgi:hypothetical protein